YKNKHHRNLAATLAISDAFILQSAPTCGVGAFSCSPPSLVKLHVSSGFSFSDGEQILVSAQRPLGIVLEQDKTPGEIVVASLDPDGSAADAGVNEGDILLAVQNASVQNASLDEVLAFIGNAPRVVNMRFLRRECD
ncbi:hypothetical protein ACHAWT_000287, partial [Skeletonema menzelii]